MQHVLKELIASCRLGNEDGQKLLYKQYANLLYGIAYRYTMDKHGSKDVLQESFIRIFKHIAKTDISSKTLFEGWLKKIVVNESFRWIKRNKSTGKFRLRVHSQHILQRVIPNGLAKNYFIY